MIRRSTPIALATLLALAASGPALASLCEFGEVAVFAINSVEIGQNVTVAGDVVANTSGGTVSLRGKASVEADVWADSLAVGNFATIDGTAFCNALDDNTGDVTCTSFAPPVFDALPAFKPADPGDEDVELANGETRFLPLRSCSGSPETACTSGGGECAVGETCDARSYRDIVGGVESSVIFEPGIYDVRSISIDRKGDLLFQGPTEIRVSGSVSLGVEVDVNGAVGAPAGASEVVFYVGGSAELGGKSTVSANFYVPNGTLELPSNITATGAFLGQDVVVGSKARVFLDSAFVNGPPTAFAQEVLTDGANDLVITLEGSDPEGADLSFSIEVDPAEGTLGAITPIVPAPVDQCSQSGDTCNVDSDCPGFAQGETCDTVQPPITQATVTYTPNLNSNCVTDPESGEVTCPEDFFTFGVTDDCGALGTAIVSVNGGTDETVLDPGICSVSGAECFVDEDCDGFPSETCLLDGVAAVTANDLQVDVAIDEVRTISLSGGAEGVTTVTFRIESLPAGTLTDSDGTEVTAIDLPYDLPSPVLTYGAPATAQQTSFSYSVRDSATTGSPCGPPSCDTATVNIDVAAAPMLAGDDQTFELDLNTTAVFNLDGNSGGAGTPIPPPPPTGGALQATSGNGPPMTAYQLSRLAASTVRAGVGSLAPTVLAPTAVTVDDVNWTQFGWCDEASLGGPLCSVSGQACQADEDCPDFGNGETCKPQTCANPVTLTDLQNETAVIDGPFTFTTTVDSCLKVTDALSKGDHWRVEEHTDAPAVIDLIGFTREVDQGGNTTGDPDVAFADPTYSSGEFELIGGTDYTIQLITIPPDSFSWGTAAYLRVDSGRCDQMLWTITALPLAGTVTTLGGGPVTVGQTFFEPPTLVYNSVGAAADTSYSLEYSVTQAGLVDNSEIFFDVLTDGCALVGRPVGCTPQSGSPQASQAQSGVSDPDDADASTGDGDRIPNLRVVVVGDGTGTVTSSRRETPTGSFVGLSCDGRCAMDFADGTEVVLYARSVGDDSEFIRWGGDCSGSEPITKIVVWDKRQCTAEFGRK